MSLFESLSFHLREALDGIKHSKVMAVATITSIALSLFVLGAFLLFLKNANLFLSRLHDQYKLVVYIKDQADTDSVTQLKRRFEGDPAVESVVYIPKEDALKLVLADLGEKDWIVKTLEKNPLPDSFELKINERADVADLVRRLQSDRAVSRVSSGQEWVAAILRAVLLVRYVGFALVFVLGFTSLLIVGNTIWVTVYARRDEVAIMRLVGATNWFVRTPFLVEGLLTGVVGAVLSFVLLVVGYRLLLGQLQTVAPGLSGFAGWPELKRLGGQLVMMGGVLGFLGSLVSLRRLSV
ncbi:MAG: ABC transporter permease [Candidatus Riflebacteria bacterium]|nr:ABC transporter permease [Candidatus Riflebacteria bacterium]